MSPQNEATWGQKFPSVELFCWAEYESRLYNYLHTQQSIHLQPFVFIDRYSHLNMPVFFICTHHTLRTYWKKKKKTYLAVLEKVRKQSRIPPFIPLSRSTPRVNGVYSGLKPIPCPSFIEKSVQQFVCNPADKPTNQLTKNLDTGENITSLAEVKMAFWQEFAAMPAAGTEQNVLVLLFLFLFGIGNQVSQIHPLGTIATKFYGNPSNNYWGISGQKQTSLEPGIKKKNYNKKKANDELNNSQQSACSSKHHSVIPKLTAGLKNLSGWTLSGWKRLWENIAPLEV